jgi:hypothetical protein
MLSNGKRDKERKIKEELVGFLYAKNLASAEFQKKCGEVADSMTKVFGGSFWVSCDC